MADLVTEGTGQAPTIVGDRYRILEVIGTGGMGAVYRAEHVLMKKIVALKLLHPELGRIEEVARRFEREAQSVSRLSHVGIIQVSDFGRTPEGVLFLVMEHLPGESLAAALTRERRLPVARAVGIMSQVLSALEHAHSHGVVHRDLKPDNIMLTRRQDLSQLDAVKILDFGIAKLTDDAPASGQPLTQAGVVFGTPWYMSPEQAMGEVTDARSDLYSCGVILYELLTGRRPFEAEQLVQIVSMHLTMDPVPPSQAAPDAHIPIEVERAVLRAMAKNRDERFASATEFLAALRGEGIVDAPARTPTRSSIVSVASSEGAGRFTLTLDVNRLRAEASTRWTGLSTRSRRTVFAVAAALTLSMLVLGVRSFREPTKPQPVGTALIVALKPAEDALARGDLPAARAILMQRLSEHPEVARVHYLLATLDFVEHQPEEALSAYGEALRLDPGYKNDVAMLRNVQSLVDDKKLARSAVAFLVDKIGPAAGPVLAQIASADKRADLRHTALAACAQLGCAKQVDELQSYILDLNQGKRCEDRLEAVAKLKKLGNVRAVDALKKAKKKASGFSAIFGGQSSNDCMKVELEDAIRELERR